MSQHGYPFGHEQPPAPHGPGGQPPGPPAPPQTQPAQQPPQKRGGGLIWAAWGSVLALAVLAGGVVAWQVDERIYTTETAAENYWEALRSGSGSQAVGYFDSLPEDEGTDAVLLDGEPLAHSASLMEGMTFSEGSGSAEMRFTVGEQEYESTTPMIDAGNHWLIFDDWRLAPEAVADVEVSVPGAQAGGIGQIEANGEPVNLEDESVTLSTFVPSVIDFDIDSQWLSGTTQEVVVDDGETSSEEDGPAAREVTLELEASEAAEELLHEEVGAFLSECADQQVLMPSGCPMGVETPNTVDSETISWDMPDAADTSLSFDADGWQVSGLDMTATVTFESLNHHDGEELSESHDVHFRLDVQVGADGEDLIVSVTGE